MGNVFLSLQGCEPQEFGELAVDDAAGGVGFDSAKLLKDGVFAKAARCNLEVVNIRYREDGGAPTGASGVPRTDGDEFWVCGQQGLRQFRAICCVNAPAAIEGLSKAAACVVTWTAHGLDSGDRVKLSGITQAQWLDLNGTHIITWINANTFSIPVNTSGFTLVYDPATDPGVILALAKISYTLFF